MNKKTLIIGISILVIVAIVTSILIFNNKKLEDENQNSNNNETIDKEQNNKEENNENNTGNKKVLVVYFSAQNHTKEVAEKIATNLNADTFEIVPAQKYTSNDLDYTDNNSRVSKEHNDEKLRDTKLVTTSVDNWDNYDTILIGYPIWWGIAAWPVNTFVKSNNFSGKTVIPFCTSVSSGLGESGNLLKEIANGGNWLEGHRFSSNPKDIDIKNWADTLK